MNDDNIFRKHPELLTSLRDIRTYEMSKSKTPLRRVSRKNTEGAKRLRRFKKSLYLRIHRFGNALFEMLADETDGLFTCPVCRSVFRTPVTVECGHTFCAACLRKQPVCCSVDVQFSQRCTNVLVQDLAGKFEETERGFCDRGTLSTISFLGSEPRYWLRSRFAGLLPKSTNGSITDIVSRFLLPAKARKLSISERTGNGVGSSEDAVEKQYFTHMDISSRENLCEEIQEKWMAVLGEVTEAKEKSRRTSWRNITKSDLECILCSRSFSDPVTTSCGHTFCRDCLVRVLDYGLSCPLCVSPLTHSEMNRGTTHALEAAVKTLFPDEHEERKRVCPTYKDSEIPVFICTNAFPGVACPLYVYEPRYRLLARRCLQSERRMFAMASKVDGRNRFASYGTVLEVKDAVLMRNGQYILTTVGHRRFKVVNRSEQDGYDTAKVQYIRDIAVSAEKLPDLVTLHERVHQKAVKWVNSLTRQALTEAERLIGPMPMVEKNWTSLPDGPAWTWWLMPILPLCKQLQVGILSTVSLEKRLRAIDKMLEHFKIRMKALERDTTLNCSSDAGEVVDSCGFTTERSMNIEYNH